MLTAAFRFATGTARYGAAALAGLVLLAPAVQAQTPPGAPIVNQAYVSFTTETGQASVAWSNEVSLTTEAGRTPASLSFVRIMPTGIPQAIGAAACVGADTASPLPNPVGPAGDPFTPGTEQRLADTSSYNAGETVFLRLDDEDQNRDYRVVDTADLHLAVEGGDEEVLRLAETGPDTGIFTGYLPSSRDAVTAGDCRLQGAPDARLDAHYTDPFDAADQAADSAVFDPAGRVFDSAGGTGVDGASVTLVDADSGQPATVFGNDGVSRFPATVVTGETVTDGAGSRYDFSGGRFRFPVVPSGEYRLRIEPPAGYSAPSAASESDLQQLDGGPFRLGTASFGGVYRHDGNGPFAVDYPVDPLTESLFVQKSANVGTAAPGDFVFYEVRVTHTGTSGSAQNLRLVDRLPPGVRYVSGSAVLDGEPAADPAVAGGRELTFALGDLASDTSTTIGYVLEIVGGRDGDRLDNEVFALADGGQRSNRSVASVRLVEDLMRSTGTLLGRVVEGSCTLDNIDDDRGIEGVRVYLADGRYVVSDESGRFHFEGLKPGRHVAQLDPETIPESFALMGCDDAPRFAGRADSQLVDLTPGALQRVDFYLVRRQPPEGDVRLSLTTRGTETRDRVAYGLELVGRGEVDIDALQVTVMLPEGVDYRAGTLEIDGLAVADPRLTGQAMTIDLESQSGDWRLPMRFEADIGSDVSGELTTRAIGRFGVAGGDAARTPVAETVIHREPSTRENTGYVLRFQFGVLSDELSPSDREELDALIGDWQGVEDIRITAVGHSDSTRIAPRSRHLFADNYALSRARALSAARYLASGLDVRDDAIQVDGRGPDEPVAGNDTVEGRQRNRRVELVLAGSRPGRQSFVEVTQESSGVLVTETRGRAPGAEADARRSLAASFLEAHLEPPQQPEVSLGTIEPGLGWVLPEEGYRPPIPALRIAIRHAPDQTVALFVNGRETDPIDFEGSRTDPGRNVTLSRWSGVDLVEGSNQLVADIRGPDGRLDERLTRRVHYAGAPVRAEVDAGASTLVADGRTRPVVAVRFYDRYGQPARHSTIGAFSVDAPYRSWWSELNDRENKLVQLGKREPLYTVGDDGVAYIELAPTTQSGQAMLRLKLANQREQDVVAWLKPAARDWILVGFGEGTVGYRTLDENAVPLPDDSGDGYYDDGRLAFFAKGSIRGEYLLTLAYDSARERRPDDGFATEIDPDAWYPLYADNAEQRFEAPSQRKLYVKLERARFNALFGDFSTGLTTTELGRYERRMNGFRSEYSGSFGGYSAFASENAQAFVRDEIQGDGTSGLYRLSESPVLPMSETIRLEVRDRFDPAVVVSSRALSRFLDYSLDANAGTLFFKEPVPSRDDAFNPVFIVADYETASGAGDDITAGGRVAAWSRDRRIEAGVTHISDQHPSRTGELTAVDLRWQLANTTLLRAEHAVSDRSGTAETGEANASLLRLEHRGERLDLNAEYRDTDQAFGLGQQRAAAQGIRKLGIDGRYELNSLLALRANASLQENLETGAERTLAEADLEYQAEKTTATLGVVHAEDAFIDGETRVSDIVDAGVSRRLFDSALSVRANGSFGLGSETANGDYLSSYVFGVDYALRRETDLFLEYENAEGRDVEAQMTRAGIRSSPWSRAQLNTSVSNEMTEYGPRLYSNLGLVQGFQLSDNWLVDVGLDQVRTIRQPALRRFDDERVPAFGSLQDDFVAGYLGALYQSGTWSINSRLEYRHADSEERTGLVAGWYREPSSGHGLSAGLTLFHSARDEGNTVSANLRFGWALRRADSPWTLLYRADLDHDRRDVAAGRESTWRVVSNLNANRRLGAASQLSLQYAAKYVKSHFSGIVVDGYTDLAGVDLRHGFRSRWEIAAHGSALHAWDAGTVEYGLGLSLGVNVADDLWISVGYNVEGFHDEDFATARYTATGPFLRVTMRAHQALLKKVSGR